MLTVLITEFAKIVLAIRNVCFILNLQEVWHMASLDINSEAM